MLRRIFLSAMVVTSCAAILRAEPKDDVKSAVQKLVDASDYSWTSTNEGGFAANTIEGKTQKDGLTTLSITRQDSTSEGIAQGDKAVVKTDDGWQNASEILAAGGGGGGGGGGFSPERLTARILQNFKSPAVMLMDLVTKLPKIEQNGDTYSADIPADLAKQILIPFRRRNGNTPEVANPSGTIKFWLKDGTLTKLEQNVKGTVSFNGNDNDVDRTTTVEFKDVGSTTVKIPDEAKAKLDAPPATQP
jgi:hypothetical protein